MDTKTVCSPLQWIKKHFVNKLSANYKQKPFEYLEPVFT